MTVAAPTAGGAVTATTPWVQMTSAHPSGIEPRDKLSAVSCPTTKFCMAVGTQDPNSTTSNGVNEPLAEKWTGSWKITPTPNPDPSILDQLTNVSCSSPSSCVALSRPYASATYSETWNGSTWTAEALPTGLFQDLLSLSCYGTDCLAVGFQSTSTELTTFAAEWNGASWSLDPTTIPNATFSSVSCYGPQQCLAVGQNTAGGTGTPLAETFDDGVWSDVSPAGTGLPRLFDVSCVVTATTCIALDAATGALAWNETSGGWTTLPAPPDAVGSLTCPTTTWCVGVGDVTTPQNQTAPVANAWNGTSWTVMNTSKFAPNDVYPNNPFYGAACLSATFCVAVGSRQISGTTQPLVASWGTSSGGLLGL